MLERAAAILEQCAGPRFLLVPFQTRRGAARRRLDPAFWQHGAAEIELSIAWDGAVRLPQDDTNRSRLRPSGTTQGHVRMLPPAGQGAQSALPPTNGLTNAARRWPPVALARPRKSRSPHGLASYAKPMTSQSKPQNPDGRSEDGDKSGSNRLDADRDASDITQSATSRTAADQETKRRGATWDPAHSRLDRGHQPAMPISHYVGDLHRYDLRLLEADPKSLDRSELVPAIKTKLALGHHSQALECLRRCLEEDPSKRHLAMKHFTYFSFNSGDFDLLVESCRVLACYPQRRPSAPEFSPDDLQDLTQLTRQCLPEVVYSFWLKLDGCWDGLDTMARSYVRDFLRLASHEAISLPGRPLLMSKLLGRLKNPQTYCQYFKSCCDRGETQHLDSVYWVYYHARWAVGMSPDIFNLAFKLFLEQGEIQKTLEVHRHFCTWYHRRATPQERAQISMKEWWEKFVLKAIIHDLKNGMVIAYMPFLKPVMRLGDQDTVEFAVRSLHTATGIDGNHCEHHAKVAKICLKGGGMELAKSLARPLETPLEEGVNDEMSTPSLDIFSLLLAISESARGRQLDATLSFFEMAKRRRWHQSPLVVKPTIETLAAHNLVIEARAMFDAWFSESISRESSPEVAADFDTVALNTMLRVYQEKADPLAIAALLEEIKLRGDLQPDDESFRIQMTALCRVHRQGDAQDLVAKIGGVFARDARTWEILMAGALKTKQWRRVHDCAETTRSLNGTLSLNAYVMMGTATHRWMNRSSWRHDGRPDVSRADDPMFIGRPGFEALLGNLARDMELRKEAVRCGYGSVASQFLAIDGLDKAAGAMAEMGNGSAFQQFTELTKDWNGTNGWTSLQSGFRYKTAAMRNHALLGNHAAVYEGWQQLVANLQPLPGKEHVLDVPFRVLRGVLAKDQDTERLLRTLNQMVSAGWQLSKRSWNDSIIDLAEGGFWKEAFMLCETVLMPGWMGWPFMKEVHIRKMREGVRMYYARREKVRVGRKDGYMYGETVHEKRQFRRPSAMGRRRNYSTSHGPPPHSPPEATTTSSDREPGQPYSTERHPPPPPQRPRQRVGARGATRFRSNHEKRAVEQAKAMRALLQTATRQVRRKLRATYPFSEWWANYRRYLARTRAWQAARKKEGWSPRIRAEIFQPTRNPNFLKPRTDTLLALAKVYMAFSKSHWWDEGVSGAVTTIRQLCPRTLEAVEGLRHHPGRSIAVQLADAESAAANLRLRERQYLHPWAEAMTRTMVARVAASRGGLLRGQERLERLAQLHLERGKRRSARRWVRLPTLWRGAKAAGATTTTPGTLSLDLPRLLRTSPSPSPSPSSSCSSYSSSSSSSPSYRHPRSRRRQLRAATRARSTRMTRITPMTTGTRGGGRVYTRYFRVVRRVLLRIRDEETRTRRKRMMRNNSTWTKTGRAGRDQRTKREAYSEAEKRLRGGKKPAATKDRWGRNVWRTPGPDYDHMQGLVDLMVGSEHSPLPAWGKDGPIYELRSHARTGRPETAWLETAKRPESVKRKGQPQPKEDEKDDGDDDVFADLLKASTLQRAKPPPPPPLAPSQFGVSRDEWDIYKTEEEEEEEGDDDEDDEDEDDEDEDDEDEDEDEEDKEDKEDKEK